MGAKTGLIVSKPSGAITPDYTDAQKEAGLGEGTHDITVPVVTGAHVVLGKREAEADPLYGLYGHGLYGHGLYAHPVVGVADSGLIVSPSSGAVTPSRSLWSLASVRLRLILCWWLTLMVP